MSREPRFADRHSAGGRLFDIDLWEICKRQPGPGLEELLHGQGCDPEAFWNTVGFIGVALEINKAKFLVNLITAAGGQGFIVPAIYREPRVTRDQARDLAATHLARAKVTTKEEFGPLMDGRDEAMWWGFFADYPRLQAEGVIPGCLFFFIDKLDGHLRTKEEYQEWGRLQR